MKIPETPDFSLIDVLPVLRVWNDETKHMVNRMLLAGMLGGGIAGFSIALYYGWQRPWFYSVYWALSLEAYMLVLAIRVCERKQRTQVSFWARPWVKIVYWILFLLTARVAIFILKELTSEDSLIVLLKSTDLPNGVIYSNLFNALCIGVIFAFPSKVLSVALLSFLQKIGIQLTPPFSTIANLTAGIKERNYD